MASQTFDQQRCGSSDPNISISGCSSLIRSGKETKKNLAVAFYNRGIAYAAEGQHDRAIQDYDKAIRLDPNDALTFYNRGNAYYLEGQYDRAIKDYDEAIRLDPNDARAFNNRGKAFLAQGQKARAEADLAKARQLDLNLGPP